MGWNQSLEFLKNKMLLSSQLILFNSSQCLDNIFSGLMDILLFDQQSCQNLTPHPIFIFPPSLSMKEPHQDFKLSSSLFHSSFKDKHLNIHRVRNSILRNVVTQSSDQSTIDRHHQNYQKYLKLNPLYKDELTSFLRCICDNPERSVPSKNVIKRVMIDFFDDGIMSNIKTETFFNRVELKQWKRGVYANVDKTTKHFYLVLKGRLLFRNVTGETKVKARECYGHQQILFGKTIEYIEAVSDAVTFMIEEEVFNQCLKQSFQNKIKSNARKLSKHPCFEYSKEEYQIRKLLLRMKRVEFLEGETVCHEGDSIEEVYFLVKGRLGSDSKHIQRIKGVGLKQISHCENTFQETVHAETVCEMLTLPVSIFRRSYYIKWIRDTLPTEPRFVMINIDEIGKDKKSSFKVRKTSMSIKRSIKSEKSETQPISFDNNFLFLNERPIKKRSLV